MITSQNPQSQYQGNGVATSFAYTFQISDPSFLLVTSTASVNPLVLNQDYTVNGVSQTNSSLWTISMTVAPANGATITITPNLPILQQVAFSEQSNFYPETVEEALDYLTLLVQQQALTLGEVGDISQAAASATAAAAQAVASSTQAAAFAAALGSVTSDPYDQSQYAAAAGTNTYTASLTPTPTGYTLGMNIVLKFANANTGASSINLNSLGAISIVYLGAALVAGQISAGQVAHLTFDGTNFNLLDPALSAQTTYGAGTILANLTGGASAPTGATPLQISNVLGIAHVTVASASSTAIGGAASNYVYVSGATGILSFDTVASGIVRTVVFQGSLTLTYNAASLILPGGVNITTGAGDVAIFVSEGSGVWRCVSYTTASGLPVSTAANTQLNMAVLSTSGTWQVPAGVTNIKVTVIGGGGGGGGTNNGTPAAGAGGTTTFSSLSATGGAGGSNLSSGLASTLPTPGVGSGGLINATGETPLRPVGSTTNNYGAHGAFGYGVPGVSGTSPTAASGYGAGGGSPVGSSEYGMPGAGGGGSIGYLSGLTPGATVSFTIGAGGTAGGGNGAAGAPGCVLIEW